MTTQSLFIRKNIQEINDIFESLFIRSDADGLADLYTESGMVLCTCREIIQGRQSIRQFWQGIMDKGIKEAKLEIIELEQLLDTANEVGKYKLLGENGRLVERGTYIVIWKQEYGQWKLHRNMFNSSLAAQQSMNLLPLATKNYN
jgi:ketosteroid isomerase-like protein